MLLSLKNTFFGRGNLTAMSALIALFFLFIAAKEADTGRQKIGTTPSVFSQILFLLNDKGFRVLSWSAKPDGRKVNEFRPSSLEIHDNLSEYGFFEGAINAQRPAADVVPYALNAPLFSDFAQKLRFIRLPKGATVAYNPDSVLQFPVGTAVIKTFYYVNDVKNEKKGRRLIETRLLLHQENGWMAYPYVWNAEQTDATLEFAGGDATVVWKDEKGTKQSLEYVIPNRNQCRGCHERGAVMTPIGPSARQLNGHFSYVENTENQLVNWKKREILRGLPDDLASVPKASNYSDATAKLDDRARAYLDINCAHCHNQTGQAMTSGLYLDWKTMDSTALGFQKTPVAAGKGSGNLKYDIVKGKPSESILLYRMRSTDAGEMMPELGRKRVHTEGVELIKDWIKSLR